MPAVVVKILIKAKLVAMYAVIIISMRNITDTPKTETKVNTIAITVELAVHVPSNAAGESTAIAIIHHYSQLDNDECS